MKYGDELDRIPVGFSRRQFLSAGGQRAARLAGVLLTGEVNPGEVKDRPDEREDQASFLRGCHGREQLEP
jgi:hypothetical protein